MTAVPSMVSSVHLPDSEVLDVIAEKVCPCGGGTLGLTRSKRHDTHRSIECDWTRRLVEKVVVEWERSGVVRVP